MIFIERMPQKPYGLSITMKILESSMKAPKRSRTAKKLFKKLKTKSWILTLKSTDEIERWRKIGWKKQVLRIKKPYPRIFAVDGRKVVKKRYDFLKYIKLLKIQSALNFLKSSSFLLRSNFLVQYLIKDTNKNISFLSNDKANFSLGKFWKRNCKFLFCEALLSSRCNSKAINLLLKQIFQNRTKSGNPHWYLLFSAIYKP